MYPAFKSKCPFNGFTCLSQHMCVVVCLVLFCFNMYVGLWNELMGEVWNSSVTCSQQIIHVDTSSR